MQGVIEAIMNELGKMKYKRVLRVKLEVGELSFLSHEALKFAFEVMVENTPLEGAELVINEKKAVVECTTCGYKGPIAVEESEKYHLPSYIPLFFCPKCNGQVNVIEGRDCIIESIDIAT